MEEIYYIFGPSVFSLAIIAQNIKSYRKARQYTDEFGYYEYKYTKMGDGMSDVFKKINCLPGTWLAYRSK